MKILPFKKVMEDFFLNLFWMRTFISILVILVFIDGVCLYLLEEIWHSPAADKGLQYWIVSSFDDVFGPYAIQDKPIATILGSILQKLNGLVGFVLLGLLIYAVQKAVSGHNLKKSKCFLLSTNEDAD